MRWGNVELPGDRKFALFVAAVCGVGATWLVFAGRPNGALVLAVGVLAAGLIAWLKPGLLRPLNQAWMMLGLALGAVIGPIVLGVLFFGLFTPLAIALRLAGRDELRLRRAAPGASYWRSRAPLEPGSFGRQY
jgi:hypothetical protein